MKKIFVFITILALVSPVFAQNLPGFKPQLKGASEIYVFESPYCGACTRLLKEYLPDIKKKYDKKINLVLIDTSKPAGLSMLLRICSIYRRQNPVTPSMLVGNVFLSGGAEIKAKLETTIDAFLSGKLKMEYSYNWQDFASMNTLMFFFTKIGVGTVAITGLVDGVNPCAFAVIAFFLSFLAIYGYRRREILFVGSAYCAAVFFTYILLGMGFFEFVYHFSPFQDLKHFFYYIISGFCFVLFGLAVYDFIKFRQSGTADGVVFQLPKFLKRNIRRVAGDNAPEEKERSPLNLMAVSFFVGVLVALLEGACTEQLYISAAALISQNFKMHIQAFGYLLIYNIMFILPLIFIFGLSLWGFSSQAFCDFLKKHIGSVKIVLALAFLAMGVIILFL